MSPSPIQGIERREFEITEADWTISSKLIRPAIKNHLRLSNHGRNIERKSLENYVESRVRARETNSWKIDNILPVSGNP